MSWRSLLLALLLAHVLLCVARIPHAVIGKRVEEVREMGASVRLSSATRYPPEKFPKLTAM